MTLGGLAHHARKGILCALALLGACAQTPQPVIGPVTATPNRAGGQDEYEMSLQGGYLLRSSDIITVTVFREPALSMERALIAGDGNVAVPLIGELKAEGRTPAELATEISRRLSQAYLKRPQVIVNVAQYASHVVTVEGAVEQPGIYNFLPSTRLSGAIALAKGPKREAKFKQIAVFRTTSAGIAVAKFDLAAMQAGTMIDPIIQPGDRVVVGTSALSLFWQDFLKSIPLFALFTNI